jgi:hypothetical protein
VFDGTSGKLLQNGAKLEADLVTGPASSVDDRLTLFSGTSGKVVKQAAFAVDDVARLSTTQTISGAKTFTSELKVEGFDAGGFSFVVYRGDVTQPTLITTGNSAATLSVSGGAGARGGQVDFVGGTAASNAGTLIFRTGTALGSSPQPERWRIAANGIFEAPGAETIRTATGALTLATAAGNGNIIFSPHGTGNVGIGTTSPVATLTVQGDSTVSPQISSDLYRVFTRVSSKSASSTFVATINFTSQINVYVAHLVEILFASSIPGSPARHSGRACYAVTSLTGLNITEIEDIGSGVSFAATSSGTNLIITATTTSGSVTHYSFVARIVTGRSTAVPLTMTLS